ncbi:MAG: alpha-L-fucosidase [Bacteroidales bacterium]|nr:alpha-L-fucosidase [Bacteroidales bacterium]
MPEENPAPVPAVPTESQLKWQEAELGAIFHYDIHVFDGRRYVQADNRISPIRDCNIFRPDSLDTDRWILAAKEAGCRFALLTATHETGFGLWQSDVNPFCLKALNWKDGKADIVGDFIESCRKYGLEPGLYIGIRWNSRLGIYNFEPSGEGPAKERRKAWYRDYCERMVRELCTRYGPLFMVWFDGGADDPLTGGPDVEPIFRKYQPDCLFYHNSQRADLRWGGSESGTVGDPCWSAFPTPYSHTRSNESESAHLELLAHGEPDGRYFVPAMADVPLRSGNGRHEWFWEPGDEDNILPLDRLMEIYRGSVGRNATLILGLTPDDRGLLPEPDRKRLAEFGHCIDSLYSHPDAAAAGVGSVHTLKLDKTRKTGCCIISEDTAGGERIRRYRIEARTPQGWKTVCEGRSVGHKRIERFPAVRASRLRLVIAESVGTPSVKQFSAFYDKDYE